MTISNTTVKDFFVGDNATVTFAIPFAFKSDEYSNIEVRTYDADYENEATIAQGAGAAEYQVVGTNVVFSTAPANLKHILIRRKGPLTQSLDTSTNYVNDYLDLEARLDKLYLRVQESEEAIDRTFQIRDVYEGTLPLADKVLPTADKALGFDSSGDFALVDLVDAAIEAQVATNTADIATNVADIATNAASIVTNAANIATNVVNIATNAADIVTLAARVTQNEIDIAAWVDLSADVATNTAGIATNAGNITTNAGDITTNAAGIAANVLDISSLGGRVTTLETSPGRTELHGYFPILNNQAVAINMVESVLTGFGTKLTFDINDHRSAEIRYEIYREDDAEIRLYSGILYIQFNGTDYEVVEGPKAGGTHNIAPHGITWAINMTVANTTGNLTYISDNMTGGNYVATSGIRFIRNSFDLSWVN